MTFSVVITLIQWAMACWIITTSKADPEFAETMAVSVTLIVTANYTVDVWRRELKARRDDRIDRR